MRIKKEDATVIVVDVQERLFPHIHQHDVLEKNLAILLKGIHLLHVPVIVTEQYPSGLGATIPSIRELITGFNPVEKITFSCCDESKFLTELNKKNKKIILLAGIEAHVCVLQTVIDLIGNGYHPVIVEDCVSSRKANDKKVAIERMKHEGAIITTYESVLLELCREAGSATFKSISALIK